MTEMRRRALWKGVLGAVCLWIGLCAIVMFIGLLLFGRPLEGPSAAGAAASLVTGLLLIAVALRLWRH